MEGDIMIYTEVKDDFDQKNEQNDGYLADWLL